jgi:hypothetical protein
MPSTGEKCKVSGIYACQKHPKEQITMVAGKTFPPCREFKNDTTFILVQATKHKDS